MRKDTFKRQVQSELMSIRSANTSRLSQVQWDESEYDAYVQTVRGHGKNRAKLQEALQYKTQRQIHKFTKALCKQIGATEEHPESDLLGTLMEASDDEEDPKNVLVRERVRKRLAKRKRKMIDIDLGTPYQVPQPPIKRVAPMVPIENLEQQIRIAVAIDEK